MFSRKDAGARGMSLSSTFCPWGRFIPCLMVACSEFFQVNFPSVTLFAFPTEECILPLSADSRRRPLRPDVHSLEQEPSAHGTSLPFPAIDVIRSV